MTTATKPLFVSGLLALLGLSMLAFAAGCGGEDKPAAQEQKQATATATATSTNTATATATNTATPTATPTPFNGRIARLKMPSLRIDFPIEDIGVDANNQMETPKGENTHVGWYHPWDKPGWGGNSIFSAHVYYRNVPAPFKDLAKSKAGDEVIIVMEDGTEYRYAVITNQRYHRDTIPMGEVIWPSNRNGKEWITLITCGGQLDSTGQEYLSRDVVVAERIS